MDYSRDANQNDLLLAWELNTNKIVIDSLTGNLKQLKTMRSIRHAV